MLKQEVYCGRSGLSFINSYLEKLRAKKVLVFTGNKSFEKSSFKKGLMDVLQDYSVTLIPVVNPNPDVVDLSRVIHEFKDVDFDLTIAVGGGSVIDFAKIVSFFLQQDGPIEDYKVNAHYRESHKPLVAIPTTTGTGSESTQFATYYVNKVKHSLDQFDCLPSVAIIDPLFIKELPPKIMAMTGIDALSQAIESYWSCASTDESSGYAKTAINKLCANIRAAVIDQCDEAKEQVAIAANYAGRAIQITRTTACHAVSYPMTSYFNVPHGQAVGVVLPSFLYYNFVEISDNNVNDSRGIEFVKSRMLDLFNLLGANSANEAQNVFKSILSDLNLSTSLHQLKISEGDISLIVENSYTPSRMKNNPVKIDKFRLEELLKEIV